MTHRPGEEEIRQLVEPGRVHRRVYTDPRIFELEMERIWEKAWLFVGHESQVPQAGDYFATSLGRQKAFMTRHHDDTIQVLLNRCPHKGAQLVADDAGHAAKIRCAYHGYVFDTDGALLHTPQAQGYRDTAFCPGNPLASVRKVPRVDSYRGFIFASLQAEGEDLVSWLGKGATTFDNAVDRSPVGEIEITGGRLRYVHDANWKILLENVSDNMHSFVTHQSAHQPAKILAKDYSEEEKPAILGMLEPFGENYDFFDRVKMTVWGRGHSYSGGELSIHSGYSQESRYVQDLQARHGEARTREILSMNRQNTIVYPSIAFKSTPQTIRVYRPLSVNRTLQETWTYRLKGAPAEVLENSVLYNQLIMSPSSIAGQDDYEAYHRIQHGLACDGNDWISQHRHLDADQDLGDGSRSATGTSDIVFRHEFEAWLDYMCRGRK